ncbi:serine/threonine protein kinase [Colletotrichum asianum]
MAHGNIEPSSILVYTDMKNDDLVLKLADFGMAIDLSGVATEKVVAEELASTSPALAKAQRADFRNKHTSADVWMLGYVLMELSVFADRGSHGVLHLRTHLMTEDELDRTERFNGKHINHLMELIQGGYINPHIFAMRQFNAFRNEEWRSLNVCLYTLLSSRVDGITARELCKSLMKGNVTTMERVLLNSILVWTVRA